ncbi:hypothetical protein B9Z55_025291 [Caenorhabditis nigoni]|uniref:Uncharacterized protein n=1 Tax=Caenorhabditis nigoni TaxID=1611254 RepID=A0A2G5SY10_9PELO|nr:hypothetical protein B9Z55_025291 [Caenorhabditis nigoni]
MENLCGAKLTDFLGQYSESQANRKRKQNGEQEQPQEPEQNQSPQIDHQKPVQTPPEEPKSELQQDQPEQPQEARS